MLSEGVNGAPVEEWESVSAISESGSAKMKSGSDDFEFGSDDGTSW